MITAEDVDRLNASESNRYFRLAEPKNLQVVVKIARDLFPDASVIAMTQGFHLGVSSEDDARRYYGLTSQSERFFEAVPFDRELITSGGHDVGAWVGMAHVDSWRDAQRWVTTNLMPGLEDVPLEAYAISTNLHVGSAVRIVVVQSDFCFGAMEAKWLRLDVGFYDPDLWNYAFIHRAAEVLGIGPGVGQDLDPESVRLLLQLVTEDDRALPGHIGFDRFRKRWYRELLEYGRDLARAKEIAMGDAELLDYTKAPSFDSALSRGEAPREAFETDRGYWD
jgi:hypothetical protein